MLIFEPLQHNTHQLACCSSAAIQGPSQLTSGAHFQSLPQCNMLQVRPGRMEKEFGVTALNQTVEDSSICREGVCAFLLTVAKFSVSFHLVGHMHRSWGVRCGTRGSKDADGCKVCGGISQT